MSQWHRSDRRRGRVESPETADQSVDEAGAHVFLEPEVAQFLDDKVLDASIDEGRVSFAVREQGGDPRMDSGPPS